MTTIAITIRDGEPMWDAAAVSLLCGVQAPEVNALPIIDGHMRLPREWIRRGKRRVKEATAHTHSDDLLDALAFWAERDHNATLAIEYQEPA